jgi:hypothetical protein
MNFGRKCRGAENDSPAAAGNPSPASSLRSGDRTGLTILGVQRVVRLRMTQVLTVRVRPELLAKADARAAQLGLDRGKYVRDLIERDVSQPGIAPGRRFASEGFIGSADLGAGPYTNERVRAIVRTRLRSKREAHR